MARRAPCLKAGGGGSEGFAPAAGPPGRWKTARLPNRKAARLQVKHHCKASWQAGRLAGLAGWQAGKVMSSKCHQMSQTTKIRNITILRSYKIRDTTIPQVGWLRAWLVAGWLADRPQGLHELREHGLEEVKGYSTGDNGNLFQCNKTRKLRYYEATG